MSWGFDDGQYLAISIETRKEKGEGYSGLRGYFRNYELVYVVADERDVVRLPTNYRGEDVYPYRLDVPPEGARMLLTARRGPPAPGGRRRGPAPRPGRSAASSTSTRTAGRSVSESYDSRGRLWRVAEAHALNYYDVPVLWDTLQVYHDLRERRYFVFGIDVGLSAPRFEQDGDPREFSPNALLCYVR